MIKKLKKVLVDCTLSGKGKAGFTLIELLIVIAILGLLATIVFVNLNPAGNLSKTRDSRRAADIAQIQTALDNYALANNGGYPAALSTLVPTYIGAVPSDPNGVTYSYCGTATGYGLGITLENGTNTTGGSNIMRASSATMPCTLSPAITCQGYVANTATDVVYCARNGT